MQAAGRPAKLGGMIDDTHLQHGRHWSGQSVRGWWATEKYRGARAYWDGARLWARSGREVALPATWRAALPEGFALDGEVWLGRGPAGGAEEVAAAQAVTHGRFADGMRFMVFDAPGVLGPWVERMRAAAAVVTGPVQVVGAVPVKGLRHLEELFASVAAKGGEGLMLRAPRGEQGYEPGRGRLVLKVKLDPAMARGVVRLAA